MTRKPFEFRWDFRLGTYPDIESFLAAFVEYDRRILGTEQPIEDFTLSPSPSVTLEFEASFDDDHRYLRGVITSRDGGPISFLEFLYQANNHVHRVLRDATNPFYQDLYPDGEAMGHPCFRLELAYHEGEPIVEYVREVVADELPGEDTYEHAVPYEPDIQSALDKLRATVLESGEFNGSQFSPTTPDEAFELAGEEGTRSILDINRISDQPGFRCASPLSPAELERHFRTVRPTLQDLQAASGFGQEIDRGHCRYVILYEADRPSQIHFIGVSFD